MRAERLHGERGQPGSDGTRLHGRRDVRLGYGDSAFTKACDGWKSTLSVVRRDRDLTAPGDSKYVYRQCP
ncbi:hypothetical protein [Kitasatospora sp. NPDC056531]|uniref:hypothetical protein n=1 Tax=Kitasatospora sp. NPDC056531 TaxID=3345856 RepID=UPI00369A9F02